MEKYLFCHLTRKKNLDNYEKELLQDCKNKIKVNLQKDIKQIVAEYFGLKKEDLFLKSRKIKYLYPRQIAMHFERISGKSLQKIVDDFNYKQHATVMNAIKSVNNLIDTDKEFNQHIKNLSHELL